MYPLVGATIRGMKSSFDTHKDALAEAYATQKSAAVLAQDFGLSTQTVINYLRKMGIYEGRVKTFDKAVFKEKGERAREMWEEGNSSFIISKTLGVQHAIIENWADKHGWERKAEVIDARKKGVGARTTVKFDDVKDTIEDVWKKTLVPSKCRPGSMVGSSYRVAAHYRVSAELAQDWLIKANLLSRRPSYDDLITEMVDFYQHHSLSSTADEFGVSVQTASSWLKRAGIEILEDKTVSSYEKELASILRGWDLDIDTSNRSVLGGQEIDIYVPEKRFGIEFNGDYWHSETYKKQTYHQVKSKTAEEAGIRLFHIYEHEWRNKRKRAAIVGSLRNALDIDMTTVYARQCEVREISPKMKSAFLDAYHIQGNDASSVRYGLFHHGELVSVMTFGRSRFTEHEWEMVRFCSKEGIRVTGGASRLFTRFVRDHAPSSVISYANYGRTTGGVYEKLGFTFSHLSAPGYVWSDGETVESRYANQMKNEIKVKHDQGFYRIFDSGNKVYVWTA